MRRLNGLSAAPARRALLRWYRSRSRDLPWRRSTSPYSVWVSEVMLQQTQIDTVIPYYKKFLEAFPTIDRLAHAPLERVLELWSGLGYYRRAHNLHQAAQEIMEKHDGRFPADLKHAQSLPGVGDYTARAVLSIAYNQPYAVLDGNVARVMARLLAQRGSLTQTRFRRAVEEVLDFLLSRRSPGDFNQALMELGQTVCLPRSPRCLSCPLRSWCKAFKLRKPEQFPQPKPRRQSENLCMAAAILHHNQRVLLWRGLGDGLLDGLWNFPSAMGRSSGEALDLLREKLREALGSPPALARTARELRHNITHRSIRVQVYTAEFKRNMHADGLRWFDQQTIERAAVSQLARKIAREVDISWIRARQS
ncbi:MAG TPA: A/G-specific adenine glycosylase [Terriglobia bacterium]|nr:A/G-specific adenine glycosylase [Terriglobia bacterium]